MRELLEVYKSDLNTDADAPRAPHSFEELLPVLLLALEPFEEARQAVVEALESYGSG